jgi:hypothetical protein
MDEHQSQTGAAVLKALVADIGAIQREHVEGVEERLRIVAARVEFVEIRYAIVPDDNRLAIDQEPDGAQLPGRVDDTG